MGIEDDICGLFVIFRFLYDVIGVQVIALLDICLCLGADAFLICVFALGFIERTSPIEDNEEWGAECYRITPYASKFLVPGQPYYLGDLIELEYVF